MEEFVYSKAKELLNHQIKRSKEFRPFHIHWWNQQILNLTAKMPVVQKQLFKYVDLYPTLTNNKARRKFLSEYFLEKKIFGAEFLETVKDVPFLASTISSLTEFGIKAMSHNFIVDKDPEILNARLEKFKEQGLDFTLDILGELVVSEKEANEYFEAYLDIIKSKPDANISVKLSSLYAHLKPKSFELNKEKLFPRLIEIFKTAKNHGSRVTVDSEHYEYKDLFFEITKEAMMHPELRDWDGAGIVIQAYLKESKQDLLDFIQFAKERGTKFKVRLVKGAYWDYERAIALQNNWEIPVYEEKPATDANYEELIGVLMNAHEYLLPAIASHNMRSTAKTIEWANKLGLEKDQFEFQFLYGMLKPIKFYLRDLGYRVNVYLPFGDLIEGMAYLVRRLLENTANNSFVYQSVNDKNSLEKLLRAPVKDIFLDTEEDPDSETGAYMNSIESFTNAANLDFSKEKSRKRMKKAIEFIENKVSNSPFNAYSLINAQNKKTERIIDSLNPAKTSQVLAKVHLASVDDLNTAVELSESSFNFWKKVDWKERVRIIESFAHKIEEKRDYYNAISILEAAKPWEEADAEISEAIDFLNYYAKQAKELFSNNRLRSFPGETNINVYQSLGVAGIISPWNFPFAIMLGMTSAALVAGNTAIVKPSENTSLIAYEVIKEFIKHIQDSLSHKKESAAILQLVLGEGSTVGDALVKHKKTKIISFTGSRLVGMNINKFAHENVSIKKKVITEMGGKNAIIVDETADLDITVPSIIKSAFSFAGQKCSACSRLIVVKELYDEVKERLVESTKTLIIDEAKKAESDLSAVIDDKAMNKIKRYVDKARQEGNILVSDLDKASDGYYVSPVIVEGLDPKSAVIKEEIFGPVLALIKAENLEDALEIANGTDYGLTGAFFSRSPKNLEYVKNNYEVGNLYINQGCTGAIVSRQAFGGTKLSSIGYKAGGPNYLLQFLEEKTITENTMRHGMIV